MRLARLAAALSLSLGSFCPAGAHALAHEVDSAHLHAHAGGIAHAHEHDAEGHHGDHELRHSDEAPRIAASDARFIPDAGAARVLPGDERPLLAPPPLLSEAVLDPPFPARPSRVVASRAGRAPPV